MKKNCDQRGLEILCLMIDTGSTILKTAINELISGNYDKIYLLSNHSIYEWNITKYSLTNKIIQNNRCSHSGQTSQDPSSL